MFEFCFYFVLFLTNFRILFDDSSPVYLIASKLPFGRNIDDPAASPN
jgi:hypothetical protein